MRRKRILSVLFALVLILSGLPMSAIAESIEDAGKYSVTVSYIDAATGAEIHPPTKQVVNEGETWSAPSPAIAGYQLSNAANATVTGTASGSNHYITQTVSYAPAQVTYTVKHMKEMTTGNYVVADTETHSALANTTVTVTGNTYPGYTRVTGDLTLKVTADGNAVKYVYYDRTFRSAIYFSTSGSEISPVVGNPGDPVPSVPNPTRTGYTFAGWDLNDDGVADTLPATMPAEPITAKALWTPATASYQYAYFIQDPYKPSEYKFVSSTTATGTVGSMTAPAPTQPSTGTFRYEAYDHETPSTAIAADGSTVINVYYKLVPITVNMRAYYNGPIIRTFTVTYGDIIDPYATNPNTGNKYSEDMIATRRTTDPTGTYYWWGVVPGYGGIATTTAVDTKTPGTAIDSHNVLDIYGRYTADSNLGPRYRFYYYQNLDGTYNMDGDHTLSRSEKLIEIAKNAGDGYLESEERHPGFSWNGYRMSIGHFDGTNYDSLSWNAWQPYNYDYLVTTENSNLVEHRYKRNTYSVYYMNNGTLVNTVSHLYEQPFNAETEGASPLLLPPGPGYTFAGWYDNAETLGTPLTQMTMPAANIRLYAKWVPKTVTVTFNSEGGSPVATQSLTYGNTATQPEDPVRDGYTFAGWIVNPDNNPSEYSFSAAVTKDITLHALWKKNNSSVSYTVIHKTDDGQILSTSTHTGTEGDLASAWALDAADRGAYPYVDASSRSIVLESDAQKNVITFTYSKEARYTYTVHYVDAQTGEKIHEDDVIGAQILNLLNVSAREIQGYTLQGDAVGYVSSEQTEYTFYYTRNPETPAAPTTPASPTKASSKKHSKLPDTGDAASLALVGALLAGGMALSAPAILRRKKDGE